MLAWSMLSLCVSVHPSHAGIVPKRLNRVMETTPYDCPWTLSFRMAKISAKFQWGYPSVGVTNTGGVGSNPRFSTNISLQPISETVQERAYNYGRLIDTTIPERGVLRSCEIFKFGGN